MKKVKAIIRDLNASGEGVAATEDGVLFVEGGLPDEKISIQIISYKKKYAKGKILDIIEPSPRRITPQCKYFGSCGGCQIQHADKRLQHKIKTNRVKGALERIGRIKNPIVEECQGSPQAYGYRNKIVLPLIENRGIKEIGFFKKRSHEIVNIDRCLLHIGFADKLVCEIKMLLIHSNETFYNEEKKSGNLQHLIIRTSTHEKKVLVGIIGLRRPSEEMRKLAKNIIALPFVKGVVYGIKEKASNSILYHHEEVLEGEGYLQEEIIGVSLRISLLSFLQINKDCAELLYKKAFLMADLKSNSWVLDAYCGIGAFAIFLQEMV